MPATHATATRDSRLDLLKWLALLCMLLDHLRYVSWPLNELYVPGRLAFPWFCLAIAANLMRRPQPRVSGRYLGWMLSFAVLSEIPYRLFVSPVESLNVMPTLLLGMLLASAWQQRTWPAALLGLAILGVAFAFSGHLMFGWPGVLLPSAFLWVWQRSLVWALLPGILCLAGNAWPQLVQAARYDDGVSIAGIVACLSAPMLGMALLRMRRTWPVVPLRRWAYLFYPLHFLVLLGLRLFLRAL